MQASWLHRFRKFLLHPSWSRLDLRVPKDAKDMAVLQFVNGAEGYEEPDRINRRASESGGRFASRFKTLEVAHEEPLIIMVGHLICGITPELQCKRHYCRAIIQRTPHSVILSLCPFSLEMRVDCLFVPNESLALGPIGGSLDSSICFP